MVGNLAAEMLASFEDRMAPPGNSNGTTGMGNTAVASVNEADQDSKAEQDHSPRERARSTSWAGCQESPWHEAGGGVFSLDIPFYRTEGGAPPSHYSPMNYRSGILSSHAALKRKERIAPGAPVQGP